MEDREYNWLGWRQLIFVVFILVILSGVASIQESKLTKRLKEKTTSYKFEGDRVYYLFKEWGFAYVWFEDIGSDGILDEVSHFKEYNEIDPNNLNSEPDEVSNPSSANWVVWERRFKRISK